MNIEYKNKLEKNIVKYSWFKIFTKRVYLPLIAIQLVNVGGVTVGQLAIILIVTSIVQLVLQLPTGYVADKWGNKKAIVIGTCIAATSPLFYIFMPNFWGGLFGAVLFFGGYCFISGAIEAFMHDTLIALNKEKQYSKIMGRAQSYGLIGNVLLITLIPATYAVNKNLPFIIGFFSQLLLVFLALSFTYPKVIKNTNSVKRHPLSAMKSIVSFENIALFAFAGLVTGVANRGGEFRELLLQDIGVNVAFFGLVLAVSSIVGAIFGFYIHILDRLKPLTFYFTDLLFISGSLIVIGLTNNPFIAIAGFVFSMGYSRVRLIVFQAKLLENLQHVYKATLLSALTVFTLIGEVVAITLLARFVGLWGFTEGYLVFGITIFIIGSLLWLLMVFELKNRKHAQVT